MQANQKTEVLAYRLSRAGITLSLADVNTLRRAERTLQRWAELECGDSNDFASWAIERDETTQKPYRVTYRHDSNRSSRYPVADREAGAIKRVTNLCKANNLHFYHQTDPRGCALYVSKSPITDSDYPSVGVPCGV